MLCNDQTMYLITGVERKWEIASIHESCLEKKIEQNILDEILRKNAGYKWHFVKIGL